MSFGLIGNGTNLKQEAVQGLSTVARNDERREMMNDSLESAKKQSEMSAMGTGAAMGLTAAGQGAIASGLSSVAPSALTAIGGTAATTAATTAGATAATTAAGAATAVAGAADGAAKGATLGPWGAVIGAGVGLLAGYLLS